jgi:ATP/ADP translocase
VRAALDSFAQASQNPDSRRFAVLIFLVGLGVEVSRVAQTTFFLEYAGADQLPLVFVAFAAIMVIASSAYATASRQIRLETLASITSAAAFAVFAVAWILILMGVTSAILAYALYCIVEMCFIFMPLTIWAVANHFFDAEDAERLLPPIAAFGLIGALIGGLISRSIVGVVGPYNTLPLAIAAYACCFHLTRQLKTQQLAMSRRERRPRPLRSEPIVVTLTCLSLPMFFLAYVIEYMYYSTMDHIVADATDLSQFLSTFGIFCSVAAVLSQVFLTPFLFRRLGVGTTAFVYPLALALGSLLALAYALYLGIRPEDAAAPSMWLAMFVLSARALDIVLYQSIYDSATNILYYAVPSQTRTRARSLIGGIMFPASVACSGVLLMSFGYFNQPMYNVAFAAIVIGFLVLVMGMDLRPDYLRSLLANSDEGNRKARAAMLDEISRLSLNESRVLLLESLQTDREDEALFAVQKLLDTYDHFLLEDLREIKPRIRPQVLKALTGAMAARGIAEKDRLLLA